MTGLGGNESGRAGSPSRWRIIALAALSVLVVSVALGLIWPNQGSLLASAYPAPQATDVQLNTAIEVRFAQAVDQPAAAGAIRIEPAVALDASWNGNTLVLTPKEPLRPSAQYTVTMETRAQGGEVKAVTVTTFRTLASNGQETGGTAGTAPSSSATTTAWPQAVEQKCPTAPARGFGALYTTNESVRHQLGCPVEQEHGLPMGEEGFQHGNMIWRSDTHTIYVMKSDGGWSSVVDSWLESDPTPAAEQPPAGTFAPRRGFGKVWRETPGVRDALGWALAPERGFTGAVQGFDRGLMLWSDVGSITVLYDSGTWERFPDTFVEPGSQQPAGTPAAVQPAPTEVAGAPTATAVITPSPTAVPTATPQPAVPLVIPTTTGDCTITPVGSLGQLYSSQPKIRQRLGCPSGTERATAAAEEDFEGGTMLWRGDLGQIYVLYNGGDWVAYSDTFKDGEPESGGLAPPAGLVEPMRGFGKVWRENPLVRAKLNWAKEREQGEQALAQAFERGIMLRSERKRVYVLYFDGGWERFADTFAGG